MGAAFLSPPPTEPSVLQCWAKCPLRQGFLAPTAGCIFSSSQQLCGRLIGPHWLSSAAQLSCRGASWLGDGAASGWGWWSMGWGWWEYSQQLPWQEQVVHLLPRTSGLQQSFRSPRMLLNTLDLGRHQKSRSSKSGPAILNCRLHLFPVTRKWKWPCLRLVRTFRSPALWSACYTTTPDFPIPTPGLRWGWKFWDIGGWEVSWIGEPSRDHGTGAFREKSYFRRLGLWARAQLATYLGGSCFSTMGLKGPIVPTSLVPG